jgi:biopolymer transport protein ExbD
MIRSVRGRGQGRGSPEIQIAPMIDLMFTLLIFFVVTSTFVRETGLEVQRPQAGASAETDPDSILIGLGPTGEVYFEGRRVELLGLRTLVEQRLSRRREAGVVLIADRGTPVEALVQVMDEAKLAGAGRVSIASRKEGR